MGPAVRGTQSLMRQAEIHRLSDECGAAQLCWFECTASEPIQKNIQPLVTQARRLHRMDWIAS